jgi:hypothetical protein
MTKQERKENMNDKKDFECACHELYEAVADAKFWKRQFQDLEKKIIEMTRRMTEHYERNKS